MLRYLARYAFRITITNAPIVVMDTTYVTFQYKKRQAKQPHAPPRRINQLGYATQTALSLRCSVQRGTVRSA